MKNYKIEKLDGDEATLSNNGIYKLKDLLYVSHESNEVLSKNKDLAEKKISKKIRIERQGLS